MFDLLDIGFNASESAAPTGGPYIPDAGECMRCGMCVSTCPTFRLFRIDEETPRRRIRSIDKLLKGEAIGDEERMHLDNCLQCRACEAICPSRMAYAELFDQAQASIPKRFPAMAKLAFWLIEHKPWLMRLLPLVELYRRSGLQKAVRGSGLLRKLALAEADALLQKPALKPLRDYYPADSARRGSVALFTGCIADPFDRDTLAAGIRLLNAIGYDVSVPPAQGCCGAVHQHNGRSAAALIEHNLSVFNALDVDAVLYAASGCGAMLSEYRSEDERAADIFRRRLRDIDDFLLERWPEQLTLLPSARRVAVHEPCSQRNVLKNQAAVYALLEKVPDLSVSALADNQICCGAGGSYMLTHPDNAEQLRELKRQSIQQAEADLVVSSNFGCALFIGDEAVTVVHPLALLARQLPLAES